MATLQEEIEARQNLDAMLAEFEQRTKTDDLNPDEI